MKRIYSYLNQLGKAKAIPLLWVACFCLPSFAEGEERLNESLSFKDRIAVKTNVIDWLLIAPNVAFDYDIVNTPYDKKSIGLGIKYNWNTTHTYIPKRVYNFLDIRLDYRFHWRPQFYDERMDNWELNWLENAKGLDKLKAKIDCFRGSENPKSHISIFVGPYASFSTFAFKLSADDKSLGRRGLAAGAGLTAGVALPLYGYQNGTALDLELGGSLGWHFATYDFFTADIENNRYQDQGHENKFIYYPFVSDLRVSLVYRFKSISKQHTEVNYDLLDRRWVNHQLMLDKEVTRDYNIELRDERIALEKKNAAIKKYKAEVESAPDFDSTYCLAYLQPYVNMKDAPRSYTRYDKDTIAKIHIDSIEQITDPILISLRRYIDSIPGIKGSDIDYVFVSQYNKLSGDGSKTKIYRTALIREIYYSLNSDYINNSNNSLGAGTTLMEVYTEKVNKHNMRTQRREVTDINYTDSIRKVTMTDNERIEWLNNFKKKAWADKKKRMDGDYGTRQIVQPTVETISVDTIGAAIIPVVDSLRTDSVVLDSVSVDSLMRIPASLAPVDSIVNSTNVSDSITLPIDTTNTIDKADTIASAIVNVPYKVEVSDAWITDRGSCTSKNESLLSIELLALDERKKISGRVK